MRQVQFKYFVLLAVVIVTGSLFVCDALAVSRDTMYVDASNMGMQDGTMAHPFQTINQALSTSAQEIRIAEGNYTETLEIYPGLTILGGFAHGTWVCDWILHPVTVTGMDWAVIHSSSEISDVHIAGLILTGVSHVTSCGICLDNVTGNVLIENCTITTLIGPSGTPGENCDWVPDCPNLHGGDAPDVYGIHTTGGSTRVRNNRIMFLHGGSGGDGGTWDYAAGHTDGGDGGRGGDVFGIDVQGFVGSNIIEYLVGGDGGDGNNGFDDTGYGGDGGQGGDGGNGFGIMLQDNYAWQINNNIAYIDGGPGGDGGDGTWNASPGMGGMGGTATGLHANYGYHDLIHLTIATLTGGLGGDGGDWNQYMGSDSIAGGRGGLGGSAICVATVDTVSFENNILTSTLGTAGGAGGSGDPAGEDGFPGQGYGINVLMWSKSHRDPLLLYNDVWGHSTASYSNVDPGPNDISADPMFFAGPLGDFYLSQTAAGQMDDSPCVNAGNPVSELPDGTTRIDEVMDTGIVDLGFHYPIMATPTPTPPPCINNGDVDASGGLTPSDALAAFQIYLQIIPNPSEQERCAADCDGSNAVSPADAFCIFMHYLSGACDCADPL